MSAFKEGIALEVRDLLQDEIYRANYASNGEIFWLFEDSDQDYQAMLERHPKNTFTTLAEANSAMSSNRNDICFIGGHSTHLITSKVTISNNRVHFISLDASAKRRYGQSTKISMAGASTTATDIAPVEVTGVRCSFKGIKFMSNGTATAERYAVADGGEYTNWEYCHFEMITQKDDTLAADLLCNSDSGRYVDCTFGTTVTEIGGTNIIRPNIQLKREVISGKVCRDVEFIHCLFWTKALDTTNAFVDAPGTTDVERMLLFEDCTFVNAELATNLPAEAITCSGGKQTEGHILVRKSTCVNATLLAEASVGIWVDGPVPTFATVGVSVEA